MKTLKNTFVKGLKKMVFAGAVALALVSVAPKNAEAATVKMDKKKITCVAKERFTLKVKGAGSKKIEWSSSKPSVATVNRKGNVVTKKAGKATIKAKVNKKTVKCQVTVKKNAKMPWKVVDSKTLRVGESFLLIEGSCVDYQSVFSYNDRIATVDELSGRVTATGIGETTILVNRGKDKAGKYRDYYCTIKVVAGTAPVCKHQWMDTYKYNNKGVATKQAFVLKKWESQFYCACKVCGEKFLYDDDYEKHVVATNYTHGGSIEAGGGSDTNALKFGANTQYCSKCGLER